MNIMKCDICGKTMTWDEWQRKEHASITIHARKENGNIHYNDDIDFCEECTQKFTEWLKGEQDGKAR